MHFRFHDDGVAVDALFGWRSIDGARSEIEMFRTACGQQHDHMLSSDRIRHSSAIYDEPPLALLMRRDGVLFAVVWLLYRRKFGMVMGLVKSGNLCGQGSVIAGREDRRNALEIAARTLLRHTLAHTVVLSAAMEAGSSHGTYVPVAGLAGGWHFREVRFRFDLSAGWERAKERLGPKTRRNLGYYRRRAESRLGCRFQPDLTPAQRQQAVTALFDKGVYPLKARRAHAIEAALLDTPGAFAMGLQDQGGAWLSYIAGWRERDETHIDWQLNHHGHPTASLSTVMRAYLLEHEVQGGSSAIVFVGLTSDVWSRACEVAACGDLLATRTGLVGQVAGWLTRWASPSGQVALLQAKTVAARP